jgi:hypothetical protein
MFDIFTRIVLKLLSLILSQSPTLREFHYTILDEHETMYIALSDISRMDKDGKMGKYAQQVLNDLPKRHNI